MKLFNSFFYIFFLPFIFCNYKFNRINDISRIKVSTSFPILFDDSTKTIAMAFYISYFKEYEFYELPYQQTQEINGRLISDSVKYDMFIYDAEEKKGYRFLHDDSLRSEKEITTILSERAYYNTNIEDSFKHVKKLKISNFYSADNSELFQIFKLDNQYYDSTKFYFNKQNSNIKFTFSKSLDSINNSKLSKIEFYYKRGIFPSRQINIVTYEIARDTTTTANMERIMKLSGLLDSNKAKK